MPIHSEREGQTVGKLYEILSVQKIRLVLMGVIMKIVIFWDLALSNVAEVGVDTFFQTARYYLPEVSSLRRRTLRVGGSNTLVSKLRLRV